MAYVPFPRNTYPASIPPGVFNTAPVAPSMGPRGWPAASVRPMPSPQGAGVTLADIGYQAPARQTILNTGAGRAAPAGLPRGSGAGSMHGLPYETAQVRTMGDLGAVRAPSMPALGEYRAGLRSLGSVGPQLPGPSAPGASLAARGGWWAAHPNTARLAGTAGRGLGGAFLSVAGSAAGDAIGENPAGNAVAAGSQAGGLAMLAGGAPAAAAGLGVGGGTLVGEALNPGHELSNVPNNIARRLGGGRTDFAPDVDETGVVTGGLADLEAQGVSVVDLVRWMGETRGQDNPRAYLASQLARAGVAGAEFTDDGQVNLEGAAMDLVDKLSDAGTDDTSITLIRRLAEQGAAEDETAAAYGTYLVGRQQGLADDEAAAAGMNAVAEVRDMRAAEETAWAETMALQQQALSYMQPVTGRMRADADFLYDQIDQRAAALPADQAAYLRSMAAFERDEQHALANSYEAQVQLSPYMVLQDQFNRTQQSIADQMTQQLISQFVSGQVGAAGGDGMAAALGAAPAGMGGMGGMGGVPLGMAGSPGATLGSPSGSAPMAPPQMTMDFLTAGR